MPIKLRRNCPYEFNEELSEENVEKIFCSEGCLLKNIGDRSIYSKNKNSILVMDGEDIIISIKGRRRDYTHPLGPQLISEERGELWKRLLNIEHKNLMKVKGVCECSARVEILKGTPLVEADSIPSWQRRFLKKDSILGKNVKVEFSLWKKWMMGLGEGLKCLHENGIAHGDCYPFNIIIDENEGKWIDFGNGQIGEEEKLKDIWCFLLYTVLFTLKYSKQYSKKFIEKIVASLKEGSAGDIMGNLSVVFTGTYDDIYVNNGEDVDRIIVQEFVSNRILCGEGAIAQKGREILLLGARNYYYKFMELIPYCESLKEDNNIEISRHKLHEEEMRRLMVPLAEFEALKGDLTKKQEEITWRKGEQKRLLDIIEKNKVDIDRKEKELKRKDHIIGIVNREKDFSKTEGEKVLNEVQEISKENGQLKGILEKLYNEKANWKDSLLELEKIQEIIQDYKEDGFTKDFRRRMKVYSVAMKMKKSPLKKKMKLILKIVKRILGKDIPIGGNEYNPCNRVDNLLSDIGRISGAIKAKEMIQESYIPKYEILHHGELENAEKLGRNPGEGILAINPLVSIMLPVYNHGEYIEESIESVRRQSYDNWELIILDDGSTDNTGEILQKYLSDPRIKIYKQKNQKLPRALTHLHRLVEGKFITWTSADNIMDAKMLEVLVEELIRNPESVMVFGDVTIIDQNGNPYIKGGYRDQNRDLKNPAVIRLPHDTGALGEEVDNYINACFLYRKEGAEALGGVYAADLEGLEDYDFWLRLRRLGKITHVKNREPLYRYRVHEKTMSQELFTKKMDEHIERGKELISYEKRRMAWEKRKWNIDFHMDIENSRLKKLTQKHSDSKESKKKLIFCEKDGTCNMKNGEIFVQVCDDRYKIMVKEGENNKILSEVSIGYNISPLALKSRYTHIKGVGTKGIKIIGCHIATEDMDIEYMEKLFGEYSHINFEILEMGKGNPEWVNFIKERYKNVDYIINETSGENYWRYAKWDGVILPKTISKKKLWMDAACVLSWSIGKWLLYPEEYGEGEGLPFAMPYGEVFGVPEVWKCTSPCGNEELLDRYINTFSSEGRIEKVISICNGITQDMFLKRPDFKWEKSEEYEPERVGRISCENEKIKKGWVGLWVDSLHVGGMEQVVAFLAYNLRDKGVDVRVICSRKGGDIASQLKNSGIKVYIINNDRSKLIDIFKEDKPLILSSHYVHEFIDIPEQFDIPVVETIHNMYGFYDQKQWKDELIRSEKFDHMIAVSNTVKEFYLKWNKEFDRSKISVVGNAADITRVKGLNKKIIRKLIGIDEEKMIFINIASFDGRKNHLGLLSAFEMFCKNVTKEAVLIIMGNEANAHYKKEVIEYLQTLQCKSNVKIMDYRRDIGSVLKGADAFVLPSYIEGWSISATEAVYSGLPLIHTQCGSGEELCGPNGEGGKIINNPIKDKYSIDREKLYGSISDRMPSNTDELYNAMCELWKKRDYWEKRRGDLRTRGLNEFNFHHTVDGYLNVYNKVINKM